MSRPSDSPTATFSCWVNMTKAPVATNYGLIRSYNLSGRPPQFGIGIGPGGQLGIYGGGHLGISAAGTIPFDGLWHNVFGNWNAPAVKLFVDGVNKFTTNLSGFSTIAYSTETGIYAYSWGGVFILEETYFGCTQDLWFDAENYVATPGAFISGGRAPNLGSNGQTPTGSSPDVFMHYDGNPAHLNGPPISYATNLGTGGVFGIEVVNLFSCASGPY